MKLTKRERWLMRQAFRAGFGRSEAGFDEWIDSRDLGQPTEDSLATEAPQDEVLAVVDGWLGPDADPNDVDMLFNWTNQQGATPVTVTVTRREE